ncbi:MAG: hypothetical protein WCD25_17860, partial [Pseudolabrys sp.]
LPIEVVSFGLGATQRALEQAIGAVQRPGSLMLRRGKDGHVLSRMAATGSLTPCSTGLTIRLHWRMRFLAFLG